MTFAINVSDHRNFNFWYVVSCKISSFAKELNLFFFPKRLYTCNCQNGDKIGIIHFLESLPCETIGHVCKIGMKWNSPLNCNSTGNLHNKNVNVTQKQCFTNNSCSLCSFFLFSSLFAEFRRLKLTIDKCEIANCTTSEFSDHIDENNHKRWHFW